MAEGKLISSKVIAFDESPLYVKAIVIIAAVFGGYVFYGVLGGWGFFLGALMLLPLFVHSKYADEVYDCGNFLLVKKDGKSEEVALSSIQKVTFFRPWRGAPIITLFLREPRGKRIIFAIVLTTGFWAPLTSLFKRTHPLAEDLTRRARFAVSRERAKALAR
jgi:hypothetical protein